MGGPGDDILIAGSTAFDGDIGRLFVILDEWDTGRTATPLTVATVFDDDSVDVLNGSSGTNWFFDNPDTDQAVGLSASDRVTITRRKRT